jgi:hypothetical protein
MDRPMGILLMVVFGVSGVAVTALAWLCPVLNLDKVEATVAGLIGVGFTVFQGFRFRHSSGNAAEPCPVEVAVEEKT